MTTECVNEPVNAEVKKHEITSEDWSLNPIAKELYRFHDLFNDRFFEGKLRTPIISFRTTNSGILGHYVEGRNEIGCLDNINLNSRYLHRPIQECFATLLHEMVHSWEYKSGKMGRNNYHTVACRKKMAEIGIPCNKDGISLGTKDPFVSFIRNHGIDGQYWELPNDERPTRKGSKLKKWVCGCQPQYGVRVAIGDFKAKCLKCSQEFRLSDG